MKRHKTESELLRKFRVSTTGIKVEIYVVIIFSLFLNFVFQNRYRFVTHHNESHASQSFTALISDMETDCSVLRSNLAEKPNLSAGNIFLS